MAYGSVYVSVPVMVGDDGCEGSHTDPVTHQMNLVTEIILHSAH